MSIVGLSQESVMAWGDSWTDEAFGCGLWPSVSVDGQWGRDMKKKLRKVRGHLQQLSSLSITHFTWGLSGWWDCHWLMVESLFESLSSSALQHFTSGLCFFSLPPRNCHADFDLPTNYLLCFWVVKQDRSGKQEAKWFRLGSTLHINIKAFWKHPGPKWNSPYESPTSIWKPESHYQ